MAFSSICYGKNQAIIGYQHFVRSGVGLPPVWEGLKSQIFLGNKAFVEKMQSRIKSGTNDSTDIPRAQTRSVRRLLTDYVDHCTSAKEGMKKAFETGDYTMQEIATAFGVHYSTASRAVNKNSYKNAWLKDPTSYFRPS